MKKIPLLFVLLTLLLFPGCRDTKGVDGLTSLDIMVIGSTKIPDSQGEVTNNRWTSLIKEETAKIGLDVNFVPKGGSMVNHVVMMATGTAPDLSYTHSRLLFSKFASDGGLTDLSRLLDSHGPNLKEVLGPEILQHGVLNGKQYGIPRKRIEPMGGEFVSLIRKDWLDTLGMDPPTNRDELTAVLKAFKEKDPGGIGSENVIPWGMITPDPGTVFEQDFWHFDAMYSFMEHDIALNSTTGWPLREGFKEFLYWMHTLYQQGLIDREFATLSGEEKNRKIINGQVGFIQRQRNRLYVQNGGPLFIIEQEGLPIEYLPIEVFQNSEGDYPKVAMNPVRYYNFVPVKSKKAEAAVTYMNWLQRADTGNWMNFGIEGEHYEMIDGVPRVKDLMHNVETFLYFQGAMRILGPYPSGGLTDYQIQSQEVDYQGMDLYAEELSKKDIYPPPYFSEEMPMMMKHGSGLIKICEKYWVKILTEEDFETNYSEFMDKLADRNINLINQERADYYRRHNP